MSCRRLLVRHMLNHQTSLDLVFAALADGNRRAMIDRLSKGDETVSALGKPLGISLPATMQHLGILESAGLVHSSKMGRVRTCTLDREALSQAEVWINERRELRHRQLDALGELLTRLTNQEPTKKERS
jgi:DNA-binding transcriptional ArsR family regulator